MPNEPVTHDDAERIRVRLMYSKDAFCSLLGVTRTQYWRWKSVGVSLPAQQLLRVMGESPGVVIEVLTSGKEE